MHRIYLGEEQVAFRTMGERITPYVELDLSPYIGLFLYGRIPIEKITYGPTLQPALTKKSLDMLLQQHGFYMVEVTGSNVPLRP